MKRAPVVLAATVAGLALVLGVHPRLRSTSALPPASVSADPAPGQSGGSPNGAVGGNASGTASGASTRTVTGSDVTVNDGSTFGDLQVRVTASGGRIASVGMARLNINGPQSQQLTNLVIPQLEQQTLAAQSANIQGVSGATYTSQAYEASLQAALDKLGWVS